GGEGGLAARGFGDMPRERRLADAGVAEQAEHLRLAGLQPAANLVDRLSLVARPFAPDRLRARRFRRDGGRGGRRCGGSPRLGLRLLLFGLRRCAAARAGRRLAAEIIVFGAAGRTLALGSEAAHRERVPGQSWSLQARQNLRING